MKATTKFIEDAVKGGWKEDNDVFNDTLEKKIILTRSKDGAVYAIYNYSEILLDPKAWEAVGKVRGWKGVKYYLTFQDESCFTEKNSQEHYQLKFICHLRNKSIEEALQAIE